MIYKCVCMKSLGVFIIPGQTGKRQWRGDTQVIMGLMGRLTGKYRYAPCQTDRQINSVETDRQTQTDGVFELAAIVGMMTDTVLITVGFFSIGV